jgi:hypothetical protein
VSLDLTSEFAFMDGLPKREKNHRMKLLDVLTELEARAKSKGPVVPQSLAAEIIGVSRQRVGALIEAGRIEAFTLNGSRFVFVRSLHDFLKAGPRPPGRPWPSRIAAAFKAGAHLGDAIADACEGTEK